MKKILSCFIFFNKKKNTENIQWKTGGFLEKTSWVGICFTQTNKMFPQFIKIKR